MDNAASGELPLHQNPSPAPTNIPFTYADYWHSLNTSPPGAHATGTAPMHTTSYAKQRAHGHDEKGEDEENYASPLAARPHRIVHAATDAYRLRLSLSPSPTKASKPTPLSLRSPNVPPQTFDKKSASTALPRRATTAASPVVDHAEMDEYVVDTQVLQAVRCYEEWRRCLCAEDSAAAAVVVVDDVNTSQREAKMMSDGVAASSGLQPADTVRWVSDDAHEKPVSASPLSPPSPPVHMAEVVAEHYQSSSSSATPETTGFATKTLFTASSSSLTNPASGAVDRTSTSTGGHSSGATHGLTSGRVRRERSESRGASASWRVVSPAASASPWTRKEGQPTVRPARAQEAPSPPGPVRRRLFADDKDDFDDLPTAAAAASASGTAHDVVGARGNVSYATGQRLRTQGILGTSLPPTAVAAATAAVVPVHPTAHTPLETVIELSCSSSERGTNDDDCSFFAEANEAQNETRFISPLRGSAAVDGDDVGQENDLQATSASSHSAPPSPPVSALPVRAAAATGKPMSITDADLLSSPDRRHDGQEANQNACKEMDSCVSATLAAVQHHPLYMKHHATVSQLYADRLLECERDNDELQLFLCWAQERAERREERQSQKPERLNDVSPCFSLVGDGVDDSAASVQRGTAAAAVQEVFRGAYTRQRGPQLHHALSPSISGAPARESKKMAVYVAPPLADAANAAAAAAIQNTASSSKTAETAFCDDGATWLTPSSPNSRFIAWVADEVDVYEALTL